MNEIKKLTAEVLPHFQARKLLQRLGCKQVVIPTLRTKGKTGNMVNGACHDNVASLVSRYGGTHLTGYSITQITDNLTKLTFHSIWKSPEGKFIEVTKSQTGVSRNPELFAVVHESKQRHPIKLPMLQLTMLLDSRSVWFCEGLEPLYSTSYRTLKSELKKLSPTIWNASQSKQHRDFQMELEECWRNIA